MNTELSKLKEFPIGDMSFSDDSAPLLAYLISAQCELNRVFYLDLHNEHINDKPHSTPASHFIDRVSQEIMLIEDMEAHTKDIILNSFKDDDNMFSNIVALLNSISSRYIPVCFKDDIYPDGDINKLPDEIYSSIYDEVVDIIPSVSEIICCIEEIDIIEDMENIVLKEEHEANEREYFRELEKEYDEAVEEGLV